MAQEIPIRLDQPPADGCAKADGCFLAFSHHLMTCPTRLSGAHLCDLSGRSGASRFLARRSKAAPNAPALPSREDIVAFIADAKGKVGKREIARAFGLQGGDRDLAEADPQRSSRRRARSSAAARASTRPAGCRRWCSPTSRGRDRDGELLGRAGRVGRRRARPHAKDRGRRCRASRVRARPRPASATACCCASRAEPTATARLRRARPQGHRQAEGAGARHFSGAAERRRPHRAGREEGAGPRAPRSARRRGRGAGRRPRRAPRPARDGRFGLPHGRVRERLGSLGSEKAVSLIALHAHAIPHVFPEARWPRPRRRSPPRLAGREDWRDLPLVTIDPADAKDHDDAVHAAPDPDPAQPGRLRRHGRHRRRGRLCAAGLGARPRGAGARQLGLFPRPGRADAAGAHLERPLLAAPARGPRRRSPCA